MTSCHPGSRRAEPKTYQVTGRQLHLVYVLKKNTKRGSKYIYCAQCISNRLYVAASVLFIAVLVFSVFCHLNVIIRVKREKIKTPLDQCHGNCLRSSVMDSNSWGRSGSKNTNMWSHARQGQENEEASSLEQVKDKKIVGMQTSIPFYTKKDFAKATRNNTCIFGHKRLGTLTD